MRKSWESHGKVIRKSFVSHEKIMRNSKESYEKFMQSHEKVSIKSWERHEKIMKKSWESHEKVILSFQGLVGTFSSSNDSFWSCEESVLARVVMHVCGEVLPCKSVMQCWLDLNGLDRRRNRWVDIWTYWNRSWKRPR